MVKKNIPEPDSPTGTVNPTKYYSCKWCHKEKRKTNMWDNENCKKCIDRLRASLFSSFLD